MLYEARMSSPEVSERFRLYTISFQAVRSTFHRHVLQLTSTPAAHLFNPVMHAEPEHGRRVECRNDIHLCDAVSCGHVRENSDVARIIGLASEAADSATGTAALWK